jgi:hypothetical protein
MRILGWLLGGLLLTDGLLSLIGKRDLVCQLNSAVGNRLPAPVGETLKKATDVNPTALTAMGINNLVAGTGMVLVSTLIGLSRLARQHG